MHLRRVAEAAGVAVYEYLIPRDERGSLVPTLQTFLEDLPEELAFPMAITATERSIQIRVADERAVDGDVRTRAGIRDEFEVLAADVREPEAFDALAQVHGEDAVRQSLEEVAL